MELTISDLKELLNRHGDGTVGINGNLFHFQALLDKQKEEVSIRLVRNIASPPRTLGFFTEKLIEYEDLPIRLEKGSKVQAVYFDEKMSLYHLADTLNGGLTLLWMLSENPCPSKLDDLRASELEVLKLVAKGHDKKSVAEMLVLSPKTINTHLTHIYKKIGVNDRTQACLYAIKYGLVGIEEIDLESAI
jgi:DNA-binding CsgD family transcriptional regulator